MTEIRQQAGDGEKPGEGPPRPPGRNPLTGLTAAEERIKARLMRVEHLLSDHLDEAHLPAWLRRTEGETRLQVGLAVLAAVVLQFVLPKNLAFQPQWLLPGLELALFVVLTIASPVRINRESKLLRGLGLALVLVASWATAWSAGFLIYELLHKKASDDPGSLLLNGGAIWLTNVIVFGLWYWEIDRGGPVARAMGRHHHPDFLFAQMASPELAQHDWEPYFVDYLYLSFTNATAFSPTDTLPLSRWAKLAMMFQSAVSLATLALVVARAVNILS